MVPSENLWRSFLVSTQRRHETLKVHQATTTNQDRRERNYNNDATTTTQVGRGCRRFSGMSWKASWGFKQSLRRHLRFWKLSENCPRTVREDSENQIQQRCTTSSLQDLYLQEARGRRSSRSELNKTNNRKDRNTKNNKNSKNQTLILKVKFQK